MSGTQKLVNHRLGSRKVLFRYLAFPLRLVQRLFHTLLQLYSRITSRRLQHIHTDGRPEQISGLSQPQTQRNDHLSLPPGRGLACSAPVLPTHFASSSLFTHPLPAPSSSTHAQQPPPAFPVRPDPFTPSEVLRYDNPPSIERIDKWKSIEPLTTDYSDIQDSGKWCARVHPEGALYFHDPKRHVYTDSNVENPGRRDIVDSCVDELLALAMSRGVQPSDGNIELVVQLLRDPQSVQICRYYFVNHSKRLLFWLEEQRTEMLFEGVQGVEKLGHIKYAIEHQYWQASSRHCELYPNENLPCSRLLKELREVVVHASAETVTSDLSLSPFDGEELSRILELIGHLQENVQGGDHHPHSICVIARFMRYFTRAKFFNFYGLPAARLDADQSVYKKEKKSKLLLAFSWAFNVALFGAPESHMSELRRVWVDRSINSPRWKNFNNKLSSEWSGITMYSTVMIAVDFSFLAVPTVMPSVTPTNPTNVLPLQVISAYISVFFIVGSLVVSLFLTRQNRQYGQESADKAVDFLTKMTGSAFGTKALATVHGLPYAMLLWGMVYFMLAFSYQVFASASTITLATTGSSCGLVVVFALWLIYAARDFHFSIWLPGLLDDWYCRAKRAIRSR